MAITSVGYAGTVNEAQWAKLMRAVGRVSNEHGVLSGFTCASGGATRAVTVTAGEAVAAGVLAESDSTVTVNHDANAGSTNRTDLVVLQYDWTNDVTSVTIVKGAGTSTPALTQTPGTLWQIGLAKVTVRPGVTTIAGADIVAVKPLPRIPRLFTGSITLVDISHSAAAAVAASVDVTDPGWPYRLVINAEIRLAASTGFGLLYAFADSTEIGRSWTPRLDIGGSVPATLAKTSAALSGPVTAQLRVQASGMTAGDRLTIVNSAQALSYTVLQVPA